MQNPPPATPAPAPSVPRPWAAWLQFPRRLVLLFIAYALIAGLLLALRGPLWGGLVPDWSTSITGQPVAEVIGERAPVTLAVLLAALSVGLVLAVVLAPLMVGLRRLRASMPVAGLGAGCLGRLLVYGLVVLPPFLLALGFIYLFVLRFELLPPSSLMGAADDAAGNLLGLVLPAFLLALFPALVTAQAAAEVFGRPGTRGRRLASAVLSGLGVWAAQTGGLLSALVVLEAVLARPGLGRLVLDSVIRRDPAVFVALILLFVSVVFGARLLAELFFAGARLATAPAGATGSEVVAAPVPMRRAGLAAGLVLLLLPLALMAWGLATPAGRAVEMSLADRAEAPSAEHPWGTDNLGRDVQARVLRGTLTTLGLALGAALLAALPALVLGALTGSLARRGQLWSESAAEVLLLPADAWMLLPALPAAMLVVLVAGTPSAGLVLAAVGLVLLPRAWRAVHALWAPGADRRLGAGLLGVFFAAAFAGLWLTAGLGFLGLGVPPPTPSLGGLLAEGLQAALQQPGLILAPLVVFWLCALGLFAAAMGILGLARRKAAAGWFNA